MKYYNLINSIKLGYLYNKKVTTVIKNNNNLKLIKLLIKLNIVKFIKINNKLIKLYLNYIFNKPIFQNIVNIYKPSKKSFLNVKNINAINNSKNYILIISTNKGILTNFEAEKLKCGGVIIAKL